MVSARETLEGFFILFFFIFGVKMIFQIHVIGLFFYQQEVWYIPFRPEAPEQASLASNSKIFNGEVCCFRI